jgi:hypothetical protein
MKELRTIQTSQATAKTIPACHYCVNVLVDRVASAVLQERPLLYGVDVSRSSMFKQPRVRAAVEFAAVAHAGQKRKTGEPYVSHCIETALIVEANLPHWRHDSRCGAAGNCLQETVCRHLLAGDSWQKLLAGIAQYSAAVVVVCDCAWQPFGKQPAVDEWESLQGGCSSAAALCSLWKAACC